MIKTMKRFRTRNDVVQSLRAKGYKKIGRGAFADVYANPKKSDHAIKIFENDNGYLFYLKKIGLRNKDPLFPKIFEVVKYKSKTLDRRIEFYVVKLERLEKIKSYKEFYSTPECAYVEEGISKFPKKTKGHKKFINIVRNADSAGHRTDLHYDNIMIRRIGDKKQVVITDPFAYESSNY